MELVAEIVFPVFAIVLFGFFASKTGFFPQSAVSGLSKFAFAFAIPVMLFRKLAGLELPEDISYHLLGVFYGMLCVQWVLAMGLGKYFFKRPADANAILGMGSAFGNLVALGIPLTLRAYGEMAILPLFMIVGLHSIYQFSVASLVLERAQTKATGFDLIFKTLKGSFGNPIVMGLVAGLTANFFGLQIPTLIDAAILTLSDAAIPAALFATGAALSKYSIKGNIGVATAMTVLKLVWLPLIVFGVATLVGLSPEWRAVVTLLAGMPTGVNVFLFSEAYKVGQASAATAILVSSFLSIFTLSAILVLTAP